MFQYMSVASNNSETELAGQQSSDHLSPIETIKGRGRSKGEKILCPLTSSKAGPHHSHRKDTCFRQSGMSGEIPPNGKLPLQKGKWDRRRLPFTSYKSILFMFLVGRNQLHDKL